MASNFLKKKASEQAARTAEKFAANSSGGVKTVGENTGVKSEGGVKPSSTKSKPVTKVSSFLQKKAAI